MTTPTNNSKPARPEGEDCPAAVSQAAMARNLEALAHQVAELAPLSKTVDELVATVAQLAQVALGAEAGKDGRPSKVAPSWLDAEAGGKGQLIAQDILDRLTPWVGGVYLRYSDAKLPDCWLWHPDVVEELICLHAAWLAAYDPDVAPTAASDWHERQRPGVLARVKTYAGFCSLEAHLPGKERHRPAPDTPTEDAVPAVAAWWATRREEPGPEPTAEQIAAATERLHRNRR
jgi:hypothetical protein